MSKFKINHQPELNILLCLIITAFSMYSNYRFLKTIRQKEILEEICKLHHEVNSLEYTNKKEAYFLYGQLDILKSLNDDNKYKANPDSILNEEKNICKRCEQAKSICKKCEDAYFLYGQQYMLKSLNDDKYRANPDSMLNEAKTICKRREKEINTRLHKIVELSHQLVK